MWLQPPATGESPLRVSAHVLTPVGFPITGNTECQMPVEHAVAVAHSGRQVSLLARCVLDHLHWLPIEVVDRNRVRLNARSSRAGILSLREAEGLEPENAPKNHSPDDDNVDQRVLEELPADSSESLMRTSMAWRPDHKRAIHSPDRGRPAPAPASQVFIAPLTGSVIRTGAATDGHWRVADGGLLRHGATGWAMWWMPCLSPVRCALAVLSIKASA